MFRLKCKKGKLPYATIARILKDLLPRKHSFLQMLISSPEVFMHFLFCTCFLDLSVISGETQDCSWK